MRQKLLIFHPYLAPYRLDFFNEISENFDLKIYFQYKNNPIQKNDFKIIREQINFNYEYILDGFKIFTQNIRFGVFNIINKEVPETIITHEFGFFSFAVLVYKFFNRNKIKWFITTDDSIDILNKLPLHRSIAKRIILHFVDGLITISNISKSWHEQKYSSLNNKVLDLPILHNERKFRAKLELSLNISKDYIKEYSLENKKIILFVGRLVEAKGVLNLVKIFNTISDKNTVLLLVGDGDLNYSIKQVISQSNEKRVFLMGHFDGLNLLAWYNIASFFVLPSKYEPFGAVVNEALLAGNYVLCSKNAGASCLIYEGVNGSLMDPLDNTEIKKKLVKCLSETQFVTESNLILRQSLLKENTTKRMMSFYNFINANSIDN